VWPQPIGEGYPQAVKMLQAEFARAYGISKRALQEWSKAAVSQTRLRAPT